MDTFVRWNVRCSKKCSRCLTATFVCESSRWLLRIECGWYNPHNPSDADGVEVYMIDAITAIQEALARDVRFVLVPLVRGTVEESLRVDHYSGLSDIPPGTVKRLFLPPRRIERQSILRFLRSRPPDKIRKQHPRKIRVQQSA